MSSLKCWLKKIEKQDKISKDDLDEILNMLDGHDKAIRADERKSIKEIDYLVIASILQSDEAKIRADERRKFAEWLYKRRYILTNDNATIAWYLCDTIDEILEEYEKMNNK